MLLFPRGEPWGVNKLAPGGGRHLGEVLPETFTIHSTCPTETRPSADKSRCARARIHAAYINPRQSTEFRRRKRHSFSPASVVPGHCRANSAFDHVFAESRVSPPRSTMDSLIRPIREIQLRILIIIYNNCWMISVRKKRGIFFCSSSKIAEDI